MKTVCEENMCSGCMACLDICKKDAIQIKDELSHFNAVISDNCINCGMCHSICQNNRSAQFINPQQWYQGWANDENIHLNGSSGGLAMALAHSFVKNGGVVCSCVFSDGEFLFRFVNKEENLKAFSGSKYVKSNARGIYNKVRERLKLGEKILFIGLPCQVSALKNFIGEKLNAQLYTIDLICHGTPSSKVLNIFLKQHGCDLDTLQKIDFRSKDKFGVSVDKKSFTPNGINDSYMISFLGSLNYTENCYNCQYAKIDRVSDITLGDSWGSNLSNNEWKKGVSLILSQTEKGRFLIENANLHLENVDLEKAIANNHQLSHPSKKPERRDFFFDGIKKNKNYDILVFCSFPKNCIKQLIKRILMLFKISKR